MKKILLIFILIVIPCISAGYVSVNPFYVEQSSSINITIYPSASGMTCVGVIGEQGTIEVLGSIRFDCGIRCVCYFPISTTFNISNYMFGDYYASIWDPSANDFSRGYFNVILKKCSNGIQDGNETGIDCGGGKCNKCHDGIKCKTHEDCFSEYCGFDNKCGLNRSIKNKNKYTEYEAFIISDENWKDVLKIVSLGIWNENSLKIKYPVLIYHREGDKFDFDSGIHFINQYNPTHITIFGETPKKFDNLLVLDKKIGGNLNENKISKVSIKDYYSYWNEIKEAVVCDNDYETGLIASVFASYKNAPLLFSDEIDYEILDKKKVYVIGDVDEEILNKIRFVSNETEEYSTLELNKKYLNLTDSNKILVVNANDINIELERSFKTKKSSRINNIYAKDSLASPFLAAVREELIINVDISESKENNVCNVDNLTLNNYNEAREKIDRQIEELFNKTPKFLTIVASPNSIPDSKYVDCHETESQFRESLDKDYARIGEEYMNFGRIYGITITDTSSYIARVLFYDKLSQQTYKDQASGLSIGHSFERYIENSAKQQTASLNSGYFSFCYTGEEAEFCVKKIKIPSNEYLKRQYILFGDHGYSGEWADTLKSNKIPEIDLSYVFAHACSTNNFWEGGKALMSTNILRQGAIAYIGSVGISYADNSASESLKKLTSSNLSLGELNKKLAEEFENYNHSYMMLGDPVLQPGLKNIDWNGMEFYNNSVIEIEAMPRENISADIVSILVQKEVYNPGDKIFLKTLIKNEDDINSILLLEYDFFSIEDKYISELELQKISLKSNSEMETNFSMDVIETMPSGDYKAIVRLLNGRRELDKKEIQFKIENTLNEAEITLRSCEDEECVNETAVFRKNETIFFDVDNPDSVNLNASLIFPNGNPNHVSLPFKFIAIEEGVYTLLLTGTNKGYEEVNEELILGVKDTEILSTETCNSNNICEDYETQQNCPQDCIIVNFPDESSKDKGGDRITVRIILKKMNKAYNTTIIRT